MIKTVLGVTAALVCGVLTPTLASAQAYGSQPYGGSSYGGGYGNQGYYYDPVPALDGQPHHGRRPDRRRHRHGAWAAASPPAATAPMARSSAASWAPWSARMAGKSSAACAPGQAPPPPPPPPPSAYNGSYEDPAYARARHSGSPYSEDARRDAQRDSY
jgi:hypothetical protein